MQCILSVCPWSSIPDQFCPDDLMFNGEVCDIAENVTCPTVEYDVTAYSCEHSNQNNNHNQAGEQNALLQCDQGFVIRVNSATYGKLTEDQCVSKNANQQNLTCGSTADHTANAKAKCDGEEACTYHGMGFSYQAHRSEGISDGVLVMTVRDGGRNLRKPCFLCCWSH